MFKNSMIHGILQFTLSIAFRYVLHRNKSRDIRCRESFPRITEKSATTLNRGTPQQQMQGQGPKGGKTHGRKEKQRCLPHSKEEAPTENNIPEPHALAKWGGKCMEQRSRRTRVATPGARTAFSPSRTPAHNSSPLSP